MTIEYTVEFTEETISRLVCEELKEMLRDCVASFSCPYEYEEDVKAEAAALIIVLNMFLPYNDRVALEDFRV